MVKRILYLLLFLSFLKLGFSQIADRKKIYLEKLQAAAQEKELIKSHTSWKGDYEQVDDILVIGIKI